ncbi:MAG: hypothetical protein K1X55_08165 [Chitinophagales bacterium]|nr:hypothetical protein [Chitinophagales bacterium]
MLYIICLLLLSCNPRPSVFNYPVPTLQSNFHFLVANKIEKYKTNGYYRFLYIGKYSDTIQVNHFLRALNLPNIVNEDSTIQKTKKHSNSLDLHSKEYYPLGNSSRKSRLSILVDTTQLIDNIFYNTGYNAFPVMIMNIGTINAFLCSGDELPMFLEATDSTGNWLPIEEVFFPYCGVGLKSVILPPEEIVITSVPIYEDDFKTRLRLRMNNIVSNVFNGNINYSQFQIKY